MRGRTLPVKKSLETTLQRIRETVRALDARELPPGSLRPAKGVTPIYTAPSFIPKATTEVPSKTFSAGSMARHLGMTERNGRAQKAVPAVESSLALLELHELGVISEDTLRLIASGEEFMSVRDLEKIVKAARAHQVSALVE